MIYDIKIIVAWKHVLVNQMHSALLWSTADLFTVLDEAMIGFFTSLASDATERIMGLGDV